MVKTGSLHQLAEGKLLCVVLLDSIVEISLELTILEVCLGLQLANNDLELCVHIVLLLHGLIVQGVELFLLLSDAILFGCQVFKTPLGILERDLVLFKGEDLLL